MKIMSLFVLLALITSSCVHDSLDASLDSQICYEGTVVGKIRSWGGGVAVSMESSVLSTHEWRGFQHVIEALNIPRDFWVPGQKLYFSARPGTDEERGYGSADGHESAKPIIFVTAFSTVECPEDESAIR